MHKHLQARGRLPARLGRLPLAAAICFAISTTAFAQDTTGAQGNAPVPDSGTTQKKAKTLDTITVTAQKRRENPQKVPISLTVLGEQKLQQLNVKSFDDYVKYLPSIAYQDDGPGNAQVYMRGVADGSDGNHSGPLPSVGIYLDEEPITTIDGPLDLHIYDISRVEALSGPQGTLYGASSQAGTLRIITNKPDPKAFSASYSVESNSVAHGGVGHVVEGFVNVPFSPSTAIRVVAWDEHDAGYIDNVDGSRQFPVRDPSQPDTLPSWGGAVSSGHCTSTDLLVCTGTAKNNYNTVDTDGARMALKIDLNDNWTITPSIINQKQTSHGEFAFDPAIGELKINHFYPEGLRDNWTQSALTVQGKIGSFDVTYAFAHLNRSERADLDYSDYSFWYDTLYSYGAYVYDNSGKLINPSQYIQSVDIFGKTSHELRISTPADWRLSFVGGFYWQKQTHKIQQDYLINGLADSLSVDGWPNTIWLTEQLRTDVDKALFGELSYAFNDQWKVTGGWREFKVDNSLKGYFGFKSGEANCFAGPFNGAPCTNLDKEVTETNHVGKVNVTWQATPDKMFYGTFSQGYRPGGINRKGDLPPYLSDYLDNYELGWKTTWMDNRLRWNGAIFHERWKNFQFAVLEPGDNGLTTIKNANQARINGAETNINFKATDNFELTAGVAFYDAKLTANYCGVTDANGVPVTDCPPGSVVNGVSFPDGPQAPAGTQLPITPKFKGNLVGRYEFNIGSADAYFQGALVHVGERTSDMRLVERDLLGKLPAYTTVDFSFGVHKDKWAIDAFVNNAFDSRGEVARFAECTETICAAHGVDPTHPDGQVYVVPIAPRTFGVRWTQDFE